MDAEKFYVLARSIEKHSSDFRNLPKGLGDAFCALIGRKYLYPLDCCGEAFVFKASDGHKDIVVKVLKDHLAHEKDKVNLVETVKEKFSRRAYEKDPYSSRNRFIRGCQIQHSLAIGIKNYCDSLYGAIPTIYSFSQYPTYCEMEFMAGVGFLEWGVRKQPLEILPVFVNFLKFLDQIHTFGIVHRDIKPSNVIVCANNRTALVDWTYAKSIKTSEYAEFTQKRDGLGSLLYGSEEQLEHAKFATAEDDIVSCGFSLWSIVVGREPEIDSDDLVLVRKDPKLFAEKRLEKYPVNFLTTPFQEVFVRSTRETHPNRITDAKTFIAELEKISHVTGTETTPVPPPRTQRIMKLTPPLKKKLPRSQSTRRCQTGNLPR